MCAYTHNLRIYIRLTKIVYCVCIDSLHCKRTRNVLFVICELIILISLVVDKEVIVLLIYAYDGSY